MLKFNTTRSKKISCLVVLTLALTLAFPPPLRARSGVRDRVAPMPAHGARVAMITAPAEACPPQPWSACGGQGGRRALGGTQLEQRDSGAMGLASGRRPGISRSRVWPAKARPPQLWAWLPFVVALPRSWPQPHPHPRQVVAARVRVGQFEARPHQDVDAPPRRGRADLFEARPRPSVRGGRRPVRR